MTEEEMQELVQNALQKTLKEIKENPSNVFNYLELQKRYNGVLKDKVKLQQDNKKLNKQLENCYCNRTDCSARIKDSKKYDSLVQRIENQQKEFIEYLESKIDTIIQQKETFAELEAGQAVSLMTLAIALEKYKKIIGGKDE